MLEQLLLAAEIARKSACASDTFQFDVTDLTAPTRNVSIDTVRVGMHEVRVLLPRVLVASNIREQEELNGEMEITSGPRGTFLRVARWLNKHLVIRSLHIYANKDIVTAKKLARTSVWHFQAHL